MSEIQPIVTRREDISRAGRNERTTCSETAAVVTANTLKKCATLITSLLYLLLISGASETSRERSLWTVPRKCTRCADYICLSADREDDAVLQPWRWLTPKA